MTTKINYRTVNNKENDNGYSIISINDIFKNI